MPTSDSPQTGPDAAELEQLRKENQQLKSQVADLNTGKDGIQKAPERHRMRSFWAIVLIAVACILAPLSVVSVWAKGEVTDTNRYVETVGPLATNPAIQQAVSTRVTQLIMTELDVKSLTSEAIDALTAGRDLTPVQLAALKSLSGPVESGVTSLVQNTVTKVVTSEAFATIWTEANRRAHSQLNALLTGRDGAALEIQGDALAINVGQVIAEVKKALVAQGLTIADKIPEVDTTVVLFESDSLSKVQRGYSLLNDIGFWLPLIAAAFAIGGIFLAKDRRRAVIGFGIGFGVAMVLSGLLLNLGRAEYLNALPATANEDAALAFFSTMDNFLRQTLWAGAVTAVLLIIAGILTGPTPFAVSLRRSSNRAAGATQRQLASWGAPLNSLRSWVNRSASGLRVGATLVAVAIILLQTYKTIGLILWVAGGLLIVLFIIQVLASDSADGDEAPSESSESGDEPQGSAADTEDTETVAQRDTDNADLVETKVHGVRPDADSDALDTKVHGDKEE